MPGRGSPGSLLSCAAPAYAHASWRSAAGLRGSSPVALVRRGRRALLEELLDRDRLDQAPGLVDDEDRVVARVGLARQCQGDDLGASRARLHEQRVSVGEAQRVPSSTPAPAGRRFRVSRALHAFRAVDEGDRRQLRVAGEEVAGLPAVS